MSDCGEECDRHYGAFGRMPAKSERAEFLAMGRSTQVVRVRAPTSVHKFTEPVPVSGITRDSLNATKVGTAYVRVNARNGPNSYEEVIVRFDALVVPGLNLLETESSSLNSLLRNVCA